MLYSTDAGRMVAEVVPALPVPVQVSQHVTLVCLSSIDFEEKKMQNEQI